MIWGYPHDLGNPHLSLILLDLFWKHWVPVNPLVSHHQTRFIPQAPPWASVLPETLSQNGHREKALKCIGLECPFGFEIHQNIYM